MSFEFRPAQRRDVPLLIGIAGPSGGGKTLSALKIAKGLSGGKPFALIDTERGRALHYADDFDFLHAELTEPFNPARYGEAIKAAAALEPPAIVVDSFSHEHAGDGGVLDMHEAELERMAGNDYKRREAMKFAAWIKPKAEHKRLIQQLLQLRTHLIVCLRAEEKIDLVKEDGKLVVKPKRTLSGHVGWIPVAGKDLPYELTISLVVTPDRPGVAQPIKLQEQHRGLVPLDRPLDESVGAALAEWARGSGEGGLTVAELRGRMSDDEIAEAGKQLFPGRGLRDLTGQERAAILAAKESAPGSAATPTPGGASPEGNDGGTGADDHLDNVFNPEAA